RHRIRSACIDRTGKPGCGVADVGNKYVTEIIGHRQISDRSIRNMEDDIGGECITQSAAAGTTDDTETEIPGAIAVEGAGVCSQRFGSILVNRDVTNHNANRVKLEGLVVRCSGVGEGKPTV